MATEQKKGKKGRKNALPEDFDMEKELMELDVAAQVEVPLTKKPLPKGKGKKGQQEDGSDEGDAKNEDETERVTRVEKKQTTKPKGKKNLKDEDSDGDDGGKEDGTKGKKLAVKGKGKNNQKNESSDEDEEGVDKAPVVEASKGKKPAAKAKGKKSQKNDDSDVDDNEKEQDEPIVEAPLPTKADVKAKGKKGKKGKNADLEDFDMEEELRKVEEEQAKEAAAQPKKPDAFAKGKKGSAAAVKVEDEDKSDVEEDEKSSKLSAKTVKPTQAKKATKKTDEFEEPTAKTGAEPTAKPGTESTTKPGTESTTKPGTESTTKPGTEPAGKKPTKAVQAMKEAMKEKLRKDKEELERLEREEDERIKRLEEADMKRLEEIQKEKEKKEKKKQKEKERKEKLKAEGKLLTPKQKQDQLRAQAMLESLKAQGIQLPGTTATSATGGGGGGGGGRVTRSGPKKTNRQASDEASDVVGKGSEVSSVEVGEVGEKEEEEDEESTPEEWDQLSDTEAETDGIDVGKAAPGAGATGSGAGAGAGAGPGVELSAAKEVEVKQKLGHLRSAVVCVLGHVDTGKTKILDKIRSTNVQDMEAGGITQQIGATMIPAEAIQTQCKMVRDFLNEELLLPGLLIIDTPGHESFSNLRSRGSSLCDIAILVVDIMHGLEPQTVESLNLLKKRRTPFVVALNKVDRLDGWKPVPTLDIRDALKEQKANTIQHFKARSQEIIVQFAEQGTNAALFYENPDETFAEESFVSMVPTSAHTADGMGNLMAYIAEVCQKFLKKRLTFSKELSCTVMEVKELTGLGTTVDVVLTNGTLREGDTIVVAGFEGPVVTQIRGLLMPQPLRELRVKNAYETHKLVNGAQGIKVLAKGLESCLAGLPLLVASTPDEQDRCKKEIEQQLQAALKSMNYQREDRGVYVQASTLGSLEALLEFLRTSKIPYSGINIGPVHKKDVRNASTMLEHETQYAVILAFDVKVEREAQQLADELGIRIFVADIIYHLFDRFTKYQDELKQKRREENKHLAIFPCKLKIFPEFIFSSRDPIIVGVKVEAGILKVGTPLCVPTKEFVEVGVVSSIESNHKAVDIAHKGMDVCVKIQPDPGSAPKMLGRHFEVEDVLVSKISRASIDVCKDYFRDDLTKADWQLMVELKKLLDIF